MPDGESVRVGIERLHLEQDAGKSLHDAHPTLSLVDLNRSGVALMEIVSKPDLRSAEEAKAFLGKLRTILRYLGTCDGDMEKGSLRADVNVSVRRPGDQLGTRAEIKNVNSIRLVGQAIGGWPVSTGQRVTILDLIGQGTISRKIAKDLFEIVWSQGGDPREVVEAQGLKRVTDVAAIERMVGEIIAANPDKVAPARG